MISGSPEGQEVLAALVAPVMKLLRLTRRLIMNEERT